MKYIDIHSHLNFATYDSSRDDVIKRMVDNGVSTIIVGTQIDTSRIAVEIAEKNKNIYATIGLHPTHSKGEIPNIEEYRKLAINNKVVAIGECGLDYYHCDESSFLKQKQVFESMIDIANEVNKPLMLHIRSSKDKSAYKDAYEVIKSRANILGNIHFFAGSIPEAKPFLDIGFTFSFTGVITFTRDYDEIIKYLPIDRIMSETDAPYVTPVPYRGKTNEPLFVKEVVKKIADIRGEDEDKVRANIIDNAYRMFSIR